MPKKPAVLRRKPGRPRSANTERRHSMIDRDVAAAIEALDPAGRGWSYKLDALLREALAARGIPVAS